MLQKATFDFLKKLKKNNSKEWMDTHRAIFEDARIDFQLFIEALIKGIGKYDADISTLEPKKCIFRQNRDIRFSANKTPYKIAFGAYLNKGGKKNQTAGYYFHAEPGNCFIAGGMWYPESEALSKIRQEIDYNADEWKKLINNSSFKKFFPDGLDKEHSVVRCPKGYSEDNPMMPWIKLKSFIVMKSFNDNEMQEPGAIKKIIDTCKTIKPLVSFLNRASD